MKIIRQKAFSESDRAIRWNETKKGARMGAKVGFGLSVIPAGLGRLVGGDLNGSTAGRIAAGSILAGGTVLGSGLGAIVGYKRGNKIIDRNKLLESNPDLKKNLDYVTNFQKKLGELDTDFHVWLRMKNPQLLKKIQYEFFNDYSFPAIEIENNNFDLNSIDLFEIYQSFGDDVGDQYFFSFNLKDNKIKIVTPVRYNTKTATKFIPVKELKPTIIKLLKDLAKQTPEKEYIEQLQDYYYQVDEEDSKKMKKEIDDMIKFRREISKFIDAYVNEVAKKISKF